MTGADGRAAGLKRRIHSTPAGVLQIAAVWSRWLAFGTVLLAVGRYIGLPSLPSSAVLVIAGVGFLAGVPHGGVDHVMATRLAGRQMGFVIVAYVGLAALAWALLQWAGPIALAVVVALSALHFGLGELSVARELTGWRPGRLTAPAVVVAGSGALLLPLARSGDQFRSVATAVSPGLAQLIGAAPFRTGVLVTWLAAALVAVTASLVSRHTSVALDVALIGALGMLVPPLLAFAVWFGGWHALRHSARMVTEEPGCAALLAIGLRRDAVLRLVKLGALPSVAALVVLATLGWFTLTASDPAAALAEVLRLLLALTVPHMVVVMWLDRRTAT